MAVDEIPFEARPRFERIEADDNHRRHTMNNGIVASKWKREAPWANRTF
jgi:hypothetical protein